jgi:hypothetical protein
MEEWEFEFEWLRTRHAIKKTMEMDALPDIQGILLVIGIHTLGKVQEDWTKEEKQDLMHIATCTLLEQEGYFEFEAFDAEGWPHFKAIEKPNSDGVAQQERLLQRLAISYLKEHLPQEAFAQ